MCCCGIQNRSVITRNSEAETPSGMPSGRAVTGGQDVQFLCHAYTVHRLCRHFPHVSQDTFSAPSSGAGQPTRAVENSYAVYRGGGGVRMWTCH